MSKLEKEELFDNLSQFLKTKGIDLQQGAYTQRIRWSCAFLTDMINLGEGAVQKAKVEVDEKLEKMRQVIHEKTAPKPESGKSPEQAPPPEPKPPEPPSQPAPKEAPAKARKTPPKRGATQRKAPARKRRAG
jgi:hypothetical protein